MLCFDVWCVVALYLNQQTFLNLLRVCRETNRIIYCRELLKKKKIKIHDYNLFFESDIYFPNVDVNCLFMWFGKEESFKKFDKLKSIDILDLRNIELKDHHLKQLDSVEALDITNCDQITDEGIKHFKKLKELKMSQSYHSKSKISDQGLKCLTSLIHLKLENYDNITDECFKDMKLERLIIRNCDGIKSSKYLQSLKTLEISNISLYDSNVLHSFFECLYNLEELYISAEINGYDAFRNLKKLKKLTLGHSFKVRSQPWDPLCQNKYKPLFKYLPNLVELDMSHSSDDSDEIFEYIPNLRKLDIGLDVKITGKNFRYLKCLKKLRIHCADRLDGSYFKDLVSLVELDVHRSRNVKDEHFKELKLEILHIDSCSVTNELFNYIKDIRIFSLKNNWKVTDDAFKNVRQITRLVIEECELLTCKMFRKLKKVNYIEFSRCEHMNVDSLKRYKDKGEIISYRKSGAYDTSWDVCRFERY